MSSALDTVSPLSSLLVILGVGDGELIKACAADARIRQKDIFILAFDEHPQGIALAERMNLHVVTTWEDVQGWALERFGDHADIVRLGGLDLLDSDGLPPQATALRADLRPRLIAMLADRPWALGNDINDSFMGLWHSTLNASQILPAPSIGQVTGSFGMTPAISIGAGPSVGRHLDELRALQDSCLLVACDSVCPGLIKAGIIPHVVTPLERSRDQAQFVNCLAGTRAVFAGISACHPDTLAPFGDRIIYLHAMDKLYDWLAPDEHLRCLTGSSTGVLSFYVAASLTRGRVFLVGHDLAKEDGVTHWSGADFAGQAFAKEAERSGGFGANGYEERLIPGNSGKMLSSIMWWDNFRAEIASQAKAMGPRVFNVNAHDGAYALIENTFAAPLPDPADLPTFQAPIPQRVNQARYDHWHARAQRLGSDGCAFIAGMQSLRRDIAISRRQPPHQWDIETIMRRVTPDAHVSPGNLAAFQYVLRSALYNEQALGSWRARQWSSRTQAYWGTMQSIDGLADTMRNAVEHLQGLLDRAGTVE